MSSKMSANTCSAGAAGNFLAPMDQISANAMKSVIDIDVLGSWNTVKATMPYLVQSAAKHRTDGKTLPPNGTGGRIIFVSATLHYAGTPMQAHVSVAKAGVDAMAMSVTIEQGPKGVTSNVIAPGPIASTEGLARLSSEESRSSGPKQIPSGRYGTVKEIADATVYLFSDTGNYVNGEILVGKSTLESVLRCTGTLLTACPCSRWRSVAHRQYRRRTMAVSRLPPLRADCARSRRSEEVETINIA